MPPSVIRMQYTHYHPHTLSCPRIPHTHNFNRLWARMIAFIPLLKTISNSVFKKSKSTPRAPHTKHSSTPSFPPNPTSLASEFLFQFINCYFWSAQPSATYLAIAISSHISTLPPRFLANSLRVSIKIAQKKSDLSSQFYLQGVYNFRAKEQRFFLTMVSQ